MNGESNVLTTLTLTTLTHVWLVTRTAAEEYKLVPWLDTMWDLHYLPLIFFLGYSYDNNMLNGGEATLGNV